MFIPTGTYTCVHAVSYSHALKSTHWCVNNLKHWLMYELLNTTGYDGWSSLIAFILPYLAGAWRLASTIPHFVRTKPKKEICGTVKISALQLEKSCFVVELLLLLLLLHLLLASSSQVIG